VAQEGLARLVKLSIRPGDLALGDFAEVKGIKEGKINAT